MLLIRRRARDAGLDQPPGGVLGGLQIAGIATAWLGLPLGGVLVGTLGWRAVFFVNVPVALAALAATLAWVSPDGPPDRTRRARDIAASLDVIGIAGFAAAMVALPVFLFDLPTVHWYLLAISVGLWIALVLWELRARTPFLDFRLLARNRALTRTYLRYGLVLLCVYAVLYGVTQWVEAVLGLSETQAGLLLLSMTLVSGLVISPVSRGISSGPVIVASLTCLIGSRACCCSVRRPGSAGSWLSPSCSASPWARPAPATRPPSTAKHPPNCSGPPRACCAPSATSARSPPRPSPASSSTPTSPTTAHTSSAGSWSASASSWC